MYQNRNVNLANSLLNLAMLKNIFIVLKYLTRGHTQMECDAMHSTIERKLKHRDINVPAEIVQVFLQFRRNPRRYNVEYLTHDYFKKVEKLQFYSSIRPGIPSADAVVTNIRALKYNQSGML